MDITHLVAFALGLVAATLKDLLQVFIINRNLKKLGKQDFEEEMEKMMQVAKQFEKQGISEEEINKIERDYRGYFS